MKTKIAVSTFFLSLFLFINLALALPCAFFGDVTLDGSSTNGTYVEAYYLNGTFISKGKEPSAGFGHYSIAVNAPDKNITLKITGIPVDQGNQFCGNGEPYYLNISASTPPTTTTTTTPSNGDGGGGGGNRIVTTTTVSATTTISKIEEKGEATTQANEETNVETTVPSQGETTPANTVEITGSFLKAIYSLGYWWILIIIIIALVALALVSNKYYTVEFK
jgi:hypothetical protein